MTPEQILTRLEDAAFVRQIEAVRYHPDRRALAERLAADGVNTFTEIERRITLPDFGFMEPKKTVAVADESDADGPQRISDEIWARMDSSERLNAANLNPADPRATTPPKRAMIAPDPKAKNEKPQKEFVGGRFIESMLTGKLPETPASKPVVKAKPTPQQKLAAHYEAEAQRHKK